MSADRAAVDPPSGNATTPTASSADSFGSSREFKRWQWRILFSALVGYALFYFVRKNISVAAPIMYGKLGISKEQFGWFLTLHGVVYGISKFANGILGDRVNARWF